MFAHTAEPAVILSSVDMQRRLLKDGDLVHVTSRRGTQILAAQGSDDMRAGQSFIGMHWGEEYVSERASDAAGEGAHGATSRVGSATYGVNTLTISAFDPSSKQPELKHAAVKIMKAELPWRYVVFGWAAACCRPQPKRRRACKAGAASSATA
jgi:assimilatory nitrate reductase catalytic subunit